MRHTDEAIALVEEVFARWYEMGREAAADPLVLAAGRKLAQMLKEKVLAQRSHLTEEEGLTAQQGRGPGRR